MLRTIILIAIFVAVKGNECVPRSFKGSLSDSIDCVCNSTYCDTIDEPEIQTNQFLWYTSTKDGLRMQVSVNNFSTDAKNDSKLVFIIDSTKQYQKIHGFGGAMTDAAALNIRTLTNATQNQLLETYFGSTGIGYTFCRIPIAGTDFSTRPYTYDDTPDDITLSKFSLVEEDGYKIGYLNHIKSIMPNSNDLKIFTTSWSAPAWMKTTDNIKWGCLKRKYYGLYAEYIKKFFDAYKERGVNIWGMTPGNEPLDGFIPFFPFNSMLWMPTQEASWSVEYLAPTLSKAGYNNLTYMAMDDQRFELPSYPQKMFRNKKAKKLFSGIAFHWYADALYSPWRLAETHKKYPDKFLLMTEACTGSSILDKQKVILGSWHRGERYIYDIIENLSFWVTGWVDWNIALNEHGAPNWANNFVDSPIITIPQNDEFYKQPMFYAIAHFSKFVPSGSYRIFSNCVKNEEVKAIAFLTPEKKVVIVLLNKSAKPVAITVKDNSTEKIINLNLPANSFNTLLYSE